MKDLISIVSLTNLIMKKTKQSLKSLDESDLGLKKGSNPLCFSSLRFSMNF